MEKRFLKWKARVRCAWVSKQLTTLRTQGRKNLQKWRKSKVAMTRKRAEQALLCVTVRACVPVGLGAELGRMFKAGSPATQGLRLSVKTEDKRGVG